MKVIQIHSVRSSRNRKEQQRTVDFLRHLMERAIAGKINALAICVKEAGGRENIAFTGEYRDNPALAVNAANRMSWRMTCMQDEMDAEGTS